MRKTVFTLSRLSLAIVFLAASMTLLWVSTAQAQSTDVHVNIQGPGPYVTQRSYTLNYAVNATGVNDKIAVKLWQNDKLIRSEFTSQDTGNSGGFLITVNKDGTYNYYYTATVGSDTVKSDVKTIKVDATPTSAPSYEGVMRYGNTYTITFTAPANSDVAKVGVFSSDSTNFTADSSTEVGEVKVAPGQQGTFTYTAPDNRARYMAIQAFDAAGNGSDIAGDPNVVVARKATAQADQSNAAVAGASSSTGGRVDASGKSSTDINTNAADVLSDKTIPLRQSEPASDSWIAWTIIIVLVAASLSYANRSKLAEIYDRIRSSDK